MTPDDAGAPRKWVYRTCFTDPFQAKALAKFASGYIKATKVAILFNSASEAPEEPGRADEEGVRGSLRAGRRLRDLRRGRQGLLRADEEDRRGRARTSSSSRATTARSPSRSSRPAPPGVKAPFLGSDNWGNPELLKSAAEVEGAYFCAHYNPDAMEDKVGIFRAAFEKRYAKEVPDDVAALTYDTMIPPQAGARAGRQGRPRGRAGGLLEDHDASTASPGRSSSRAGSPDPTKSVVLKQFKGGKPTFVTNIDPD